MFELQAKYPVKAEFRSAMEAEAMAENPSPVAQESVQLHCAVGDLSYTERVRAALHTVKVTDALGDGWNPDHLVQYFDGHLPRFQAHIDFWKRMEGRGEIPSKVYDFGTPFPFSSWYWALNYGSRIVYGCLGKFSDVSEDVKYQEINLCRRPDLSPADLVIATEVLEHLPCNLYDVVDWLRSLVNPGGHLLLSFPLGGLRAEGYERDWPEKYDEASAHIREFTRDTSESFISHIGMEIVEDAFVFTQAYGGTIRNVLMRRPA